MSKIDRVKPGMIVRSRPRVGEIIRFGSVEKDLVWVQWHPWTAPELHSIYDLDLMEDEEVDQ